jgi:hypothetical protein
LLVGHDHGPVATAPELAVQSFSNSRQGPRPRIARPQDRQHGAIKVRRVLLERMLAVVNVEEVGGISEPSPAPLLHDPHLQGVALLLRRLN